MKQRTRGIRNGFLCLCFGLAATGAQAPALAQAQAPPAQAPRREQTETTLPDVKVIGPKWETRRGGYLISSDFKIDPKMSAVIFPAEAFQKGDIFDFRTVHMSDDEYFVLQECASLDCTMARILQVWTKNGALGLTSRDPNKFWIPDGGKFFMWMQRFPMAGGGTFNGFEPSSPPLVFNPTGTPEQFHQCDVTAAQEKGPEKVVESTHDGSQMKLRFASGATVFIQRMRAAE